MNRRAAYVATGLIIVGLGFQFFFRYQYVHLVGGYVMRIDRVTQASCYMPCTPSPAPPPTPKPTPYSDEAAWETVYSAYENRDEKAIQLAKHSPRASSVVADNGGGNFEWTTRYDAGYGFFQSWYKEPIMNKGAHFSPKDYKYAYPKTSTPVLVCYCDAKGRGWRWEVHLDTGDAYYVNDNADLMKEYGVTLSTPQP